MNRHLSRATLLAALLGLSLTAAHADDAGSATITATIRVDGGALIDLEIPKDALRQAQPFEVKARITNRTGVDLTALNAVLHADSGRLVANGGLARQLHNLSPNNTGVVSWTVCANQPGAFVLLVALTATAAGGAIEAGSSIALVAQIGKQPGKRCPPGFDAGPQAK